MERTKTTVLWVVLALSLFVTISGCVYEEDYEEAEGQIQDGQDPTEGETDLRIASAGDFFSCEDLPDDPSVQRGIIFISRDMLEDNKKYLDILGIGGTSNNITVALADSNVRYFYSRNSWETYLYDWQMINDTEAYLRQWSAVACWKGFRLGPEDSVKVVILEKGDSVEKVAETVENFPGKIDFVFFDMHGWPGALYVMHKKWLKTEDIWELAESFPSIQQKFSPDARIFIVSCYSAIVGQSSGESVGRAVGNLFGVKTFASMVTGTVGMNNDRTFHIQGTFGVTE